MGKILKKIRIHFFNVLIIVLFWGVSVTCFAEDNDRIAESKNGIVKIATGLVSQDGVFYDIKVTSGFIISNSDNNVYIVTVNSGVTLSASEKDEFYKAKKINKESSQLSEAIRLIIEGDVSTEVSVVAKSEDDDFCILNTENVIQKREALAIEDNKTSNIGDIIYALGFIENSDSNSHNQYNFSEVNIQQGNIQDTSANISGNIVLQHSVSVDGSNIGGPLLNSDGYVIGINKAKYTDDLTNAYYAIPIATVTKVLDNYGVIYNSSNRVENIRKLRALYAECEKSIEEKRYKNDNITQLSNVLEEVQESFSNSSITTEQLQQAVEKLEIAKSEMKLKTPKTLILIIVLAVCIVVQIIWLTYLLIIKYRKKKSTIKKEVPQKEIKEEVSIEEIKVDIQEKSNKTIDKEKNEDNSAAKENINAMMNIEKYQEERTQYIFGNKTEILRQEYAKLKRKKTGQVIILNKEHYKLGKNPETTDFAITDNNAVSRIHALVKWQDGNYMIYDMDSVNGTFVNGEEVGNDGQIIKNGDEITLADEVFQFSE